MRDIMVVTGYTMDQAMHLGSQFEIVANVHVTGYTQIGDKIEIHFEENETITEADVTGHHEGNYDGDDYDDYDDYSDASWRDEDE